MHPPRQASRSPGHQWSVCAFSSPSGRSRLDSATQPCSTLFTDPNAPWACAVYERHRTAASSIHLIATRRHACQLHRACACPIRPCQQVPTPVLDYRELAVNITPSTVFGSRWRRPTQLHGHMTPSTPRDRRRSCPAQLTRTLLHPNGRGPPPPCASPQRPNTKTQRDPPPEDASVSHLSTYIAIVRDPVTPVRHKPSGRGHIFFTLSHLGSSRTRLPPARLRLAPS